MKQVTTGRKVVTLALVVGMLAGPYTYGGTTTLNGGTLTLANYYSADEWAVAADSALYASLNFPSYLNGPLTGSATLTTSGYFGSLLYFVNNGAGNTFNGNITVDAGTLRIAGSPFTFNGGFTAPSMTSGDTITINRAGTLYIDDNVGSSTASYTADRFGTAGNRPAVNLAGGRIELNGLNNASSSVQTFGNLTVSSGQAILFITRFNGNPTFTFDSLSISKGAVANFYSATLGTGTSDSRITFSTPPTLVNGILAGAKVWKPGEAGQGAFATYGANGVTAFTAYDVYNAMDINAATSAQNVQMTGAFAPVALTADVTVNSLNFNGNGGTWSLGGNKLTLGSGMFLRNNVNTAVTINNGTLTAGNGTDAIDLNIFTAQQTVTIDAVIADNASSVVTLVKSHGNTLTLGADNTYAGGTYVVDGQLNTGSTANRAYLGTGKATVNNAYLQLGAIGATSSSTGDDFTAINGGKIQISNNNHGSVDTFNIGVNSIIGGLSGSGSGLASLTRGTSIALASGAIISPNSALSAALNLTTGMIQNLGTSADLYYGLYDNQANAGGSLNIGSGTGFRGISIDRNRGAKAWQLGTINIGSGTTSVDFQGDANYSAALVLTLGNGTTAGAPVINFAGSGTVDINTIGPLTLNDDTATYGNSGSSQNVRFVSTAGSTLTVTAATGMGSGTGIASALVQNGGILAIGNTAALNGNVTVEAGGKFNANQAAGLTGSGALTFNEGSIIDISNATGFSGSQASAASIAAGTIIRVAVNNPGTAGTTLDSFFASNSPIYQLTGSDINVPDPTSPETATLTLNKNGSGVGGILINGSASTYFRNRVKGHVTIGTNGGVIAATTGTELQVQENIVGTGVTLTIGTTNIIDGAPKLGTVALGSAAGSNPYTGETIINAGTLRTGYADVLGATSNQLTVNAGGTLLMNNNNQTVGNLTGTGGTINLGSGTLTIGQGDNGGGNYQGSIQGTNGKFTKTGTGTNTISGANTYTGATTVNGGKLLINGDQSTASGTVTVGAGATLGGTGIIGGNVTIADTGRLAFHLSTVAASHDKLELAATRTLTFSGASVLDITDSGILTEPGIYTLVTAPGGIIGTLPATVNLPTDYTATVQVTGNDLELNVTGVPARGGPLDYFEFSAIASPQVAGTEITAITLTARDAGGLTANFNGTVTFSGTAGITGESGTFTQGVLTGVSVTPTVAGSGMTIIVTDSVSSKTGTATFDVNPGVLDHFTISTIGSPQTAGTAITGITLTARDANTNTVTSFGGTVTYSGTAGISGPSASFTAGVLAGVSVTPTVAGSGRTFTVTDSGTTGTATFDVNPGAVHHFTITGFAPTGVVGTPVTGITITAQDANNNTVTGFSGTVTYGGTAGISGTSASFTAGVLTGGSVTPTEAGTDVTFTVSDGSGNTGSVGSTVGWVDGMVMMAAASVQVSTTSPVASVRANSLYPPVTYAKTGGRDAALFNVNATTGELTLTSPAGVVGTKYYVLVEATDSKPVTPNVDSILVEVTSLNAVVLSGSVIKFR